MASDKYASSILLPDNNVVFRNIKNAKRFAIDIGGSLTKIAYYSTVSYRRALYNVNKDDQNQVADNEHSYESSEVERLHFVKFETKYIEQCLQFIHNHLVFSKEDMKGKSIKATGGGAYKYAELLQQKLGLTVEKEDEIGCIINGCNFLLRNIPDEQFTFCRHGDDGEYHFINSEPTIFPYLLVNIGSGVSIMKVEADDKYERVGGTSMGGGTFWGLGSLLTNGKNFDELLQLASEGDHKNVDLLVKDIYGGDYSALGLTGDIIASSFGKVMHHGLQGEDGHKVFSEADIARSLLFAVSNDIGQLASLYAMLHGLKKVYFGGYFSRNHPLSMHTISFAINYWSRGAVQALFLRHEGYLGAIGAFLRGTEECDPEKYSWGEHYPGSSGLQSPLIGNPCFNLLPGAFDQLEIDRFDQPLTYLPFLAHPQEYVADTVDLTTDKEARDYWLSCFEGSLGSFVECAVTSQPLADDRVERANRLREKFLHRLRNLTNHPFAYGNLTVRSLLDMREQSLYEFDFPDPYLQQKENEVEQAIALLHELLTSIDMLEWRERQEALIKGLLAGNMFDWGAKEAAKLMEKGMGFSDAREKLQARPWLIDDLDKWISRLMDSPAYKCATIFVDNSGFDIVLGIFPLARELLKMGTKVVLCANTKPALNDITANELQLLMLQISKICPIIGKHFLDGLLVVRESGQASPCLDLSRLPQSLAEELKLWNCDLIILEGMGRAVHTNLKVEMTCDCLKLAVIKNLWLAHRLGGDMFAVMCKFEPSPKSQVISTQVQVKSTQVQVKSTQVQV